MSMFEHNENCRVYAGGTCSCHRFNEPPTEMTSLREIKSRLAAIEQGQKEQFEYLYTLAKKGATSALVSTEHQSLRLYIQGIEQKVKEIQGALLHQQFKRNGKRRRK